MISAWSRRPGLDWIFAVVAIGVWLLAQVIGWTTPLEDVNADTRRAIYIALGTLGATTIALFVIPVSIALGLASRERLARMLSSKQGELRRAVAQAGIAGVTVLVYSVVAVAFDAGTTTDSAGLVTDAHNAPWLRALAPGMMVLVVLSIARTLMVLTDLLQISEIEAAPSSAESVRNEGRRLRVANGRHD